jgi:hypothetical protein
MIFKLYITGSSRKLQNKPSYVRQREQEGTYQHNYRSSGSIKSVTFVDPLGDYKLPIH